MEMFPRIIYATEKNYLAMQVMCCIVDGDTKTIRYLKAAGASGYANGMRGVLKSSSKQVSIGKEYFHGEKNNEIVLSKDAKNRITHLELVTKDERFILVHSEEDLPEAIYEKLERTSLPIPRGNSELREVWKNYLGNALKVYLKRCDIYKSDSFNLLEGAKAFMFDTEKSMKLIENEIYAGVQEKFLPHDVINGEKIFYSAESTSFWDSINTPYDYIKEFSADISKSIAENFKPYFDGVITPAEKECFAKALRPLFPVQETKVAAITRNWQRSKSLLLNAATGTGKSTMGPFATFIHANTVLKKQGYRVLYLLPSRLTKEVPAEIGRVIPGARVIPLKNISDVTHLDFSVPVKVPTFYVLSYEKAKLGNSYKYRGIYRDREYGGVYNVCKKCKQKLPQDVNTCPSCGGHTEVKMTLTQGFICPECGQIQTIKDSIIPLREKDVRIRNDINNKCSSCGAAMWSIENKHKKKSNKIPLATVIKKRKLKFDYLLVDELHNLKGGNTANGNILGTLTSSCKYKLGMTGTLMAGYPDDIFYILARLFPAYMNSLGYSYHDAAKFSSEVGLYEKRVTYSNEEYNKNSKGKQISSTVKKRPGFAAEMIVKAILPFTITMDLEELEGQLPSYHRIEYRVPMEKNMKAQYLIGKSILVDYARNAIRQGANITGVCSVMINGLRQLTGIPCGYTPILSPALVDYIKVDGEVKKVKTPGRKLFVPKDNDPYKLYAKEETMMKILQQHDGENCMIYADRVEAQKRLEFIFQNADQIPGAKKIRFAVLRSDTCKIEDRQSWIKEQLQLGVKVIITSPELVKEGLNLQAIPIIIWEQCGYKTNTLRQSSMRAWRIGQTKECYIYYITQEGCIEEVISDLLSKKEQVAKQVEGRSMLFNFDQGDNDSIESAVTKALLNKGSVETQYLGEIGVYEDLPELDYTSTDVPDIIETSASAAVEENPESAASEESISKEIAEAVAENAGAVSEEAEKVVEKAIERAKKTEKVSNADDAEVSKSDWSVFYKFSLKQGGIKKALRIASELKGYKVDYIPSEFKTYGELRALCKALKSM